MADKILLEPTITSHWKKVVKHAEDRCHCSLDEELESYLIFTLIRFTSNNDLASKVMATEFLQSLNLMGYARQAALRDVGDQCLLVAGLFPQTASKRLVSVNYYVDLGRNAYQQLSEILKQAFSNLYLQLSRQFIQLMDVLHNIRQEQTLMPLEALELWSQSGSQHAFKLLSDNNRVLPIKQGSRLIN